MFGEGYAALPKAGIEAIPKQLLQNLKNTTFKFNCKVVSIKDREITLADNAKLESHVVIVAADATNLISDLKNITTEWKSCDTLYFETESRTIRKPLIGLIPKFGTLINNVFYHTSLNTSAKPNKELLSVTVIDNQNLSKEVLVERVERELKEYCSIDSSKFIKQYSIPKALPKLNDLQYEMLASETRLTSGIFLAGDTQLNGSLNAAMISGEKAALGAIAALSSDISAEIIKAE